MVNWRRLLRMSNRSFLVFIFFFSMSTTCLYFIYVAPGIANTYFFMVQAQGIMLRENVRTIGQMIRLYTNKNSTVNGTDYPDGSNSSEYLVQPTTYLPENFTYAQNLSCPERLPSMKGLMEVNMTEIPMEDIELKFSKFFDIEFGGHWTPKDCRPPWKVAILIPFRNRHEHLPILFQHLIPMLQRQRLQFAFYVIEQPPTNSRNSDHFTLPLSLPPSTPLLTHSPDYATSPTPKSGLYITASQRVPVLWKTSFLVPVPKKGHPVTLNNYRPIALTSHIMKVMERLVLAHLRPLVCSSQDPLLPYREFFGGVSGLTVDQFRKINGFPNAFWGWGGEDDDLWNRVHYSGLNVTRPDGEIGKYKSIPHHHRGEVQFLGRYKLLRYSKERQHLDGLNNLHYSPHISLSSLYKNITVDLNPELVPITDY
nr:PREDICTED: beta-1,4-galactosyltransferase 6-like [Paralichthys olivaceus]